VGITDNVPSNLHSDTVDTGVWVVGVIAALTADETLMWVVIAIAIVWAVVKVVQTIVNGIVDVKYAKYGKGIVEDENNVSEPGHSSRYSDDADG
jgi:hypothetical protein